MTPEQAAALRQPFPSSAVGKLPKPYKKDSPKGNCPECSGYHGLPAVHLDYVGHAATTDRLLTVDPDWSWEPMGTDQAGLPAPDAQGNLWIRLTVCGVTRIGVGDGASMKERIGDAIRNAAMRFGVALDLWSKEELEQAHGPASLPPFSEHGTHETSVPGDAPAPPPEASQEHPPSPGAEHTDGPMDDKTRREMFACFGEKQIPEEEQLDRINRLLGTAYESRGDLTQEHAKTVIAAVRKLPKPTPAGAK